MIFHIICVIILYKGNKVYSLPALIFLISILVIIFIFVAIFKRQINFYVTGLDSGFTFSDLSLLWQVSEICEIKNPMTLFYSLESLKKCMEHISAIANSDETDARMQLLLSKLFNYRTKLQNESDKKKTIESTKSLEVGQKLRIILPGKGVFTSEILANGKELILSVPKQNNLVTIPGEDWVNKVINIYLWRKADARYVFDSVVTSQGLYIGKSSITVKHSYNLVRTQKRKSVRAKCQIYGNLFIVKSNDVDYYTVETRNGYKCLIEDISESGALIRIGGKGVQNVKIKLQFTIHSRLIVMYGIVRTVEFNESDNQTLLHFECTHIETTMKNEILRYVYDILPQSQKEIIQALNETEEDEKINNDNSQLNNSEIQQSEKQEETPIELESEASKDVAKKSPETVSELSKNYYEDDIEGDILDKEIKASIPGNESDDEYDEIITDDEINIFD